MADSMYEIKTWSNRILKCTGDHKQLVYNGKEYIWKRTDKLIPNKDRLIIRNTVKPLPDDDGELLFIKDDFKTTTQKKVENPVYIVKQGDTLWDIANKFDGISVSELMKHNNLNSNQLKPGEKILLPTS